MKDKIIRKCPICKEKLKGMQEAREHAIKTKHWGVYTDNFSGLGLSIG